MSTRFGRRFGERYGRRFGAPGSGSPRFTVNTGTYTGDGTASRAIATGLTNLKAVIVKGGANKAVLYISGMVNAANLIDNLVASILSLNTDGSFTVNSNAGVNANGTVYEWIAIGAAANAVDFAFGTYTGDGTSGRDIPLPFTPALVIVKRSTSSTGVFCSTAHPAGSCSTFAAAATQTTSITALGTNKFTVGSGATANGAANTYYWIAFAASPRLFVGSYTGNAADNRDIASGAASIGTLFTKSASGTPAVMRTDTFADDSSALVDATAPAANLIQRFNSDGSFDLGSDSNVNASTTVFYTFGFRPLFF